jgi:hypothetical protein
MKQKKVNKYMRTVQPNGDNEKINSKDLKNMAAKPELMSVNDIESMEDSLTEAQKYNKKIIRILDQRELSEFNLVGNSILFRPFKLIEETSKTGLSITERKEKALNDQSLKMTYKDLAFPYQTKGVIVKISDEAAEMHKSKFKVGSIVHLPHGLWVSYPRMLFKLNKNNWAPEDNEEYLTLIVSANTVEAYE